MTIPVRSIADEYVDETAFTHALMIELCRLPGVRVWRQNCGTVPVRDERGRVVRVFDAGPPPGAADVSGGIAPEGLRLEIELKMPGQKRSREQMAWAKFCARSGFVYALVTYDALLTLEGNCQRGARIVADAIGARRDRR